MSKFFMIALAALIAFTAAPAFAELQNVVVGGELQIRGNWYSSAATIDGVNARNPLYQGPWTTSFAPFGNPAQGLRWQAGQLPRRALGFRGGDVFAPFDLSNEGPSNAFVEQRTRLNVRADFTNDVSAFVEFDYYDVWGNDFRSDYITGADAVRANNDDVQLYQAYIQADNMWGMPLRLRVGRQELQFGSEWLVGNQDAGAGFAGLSFDAIRLDYTTDLFSVTGFASKLWERSPIEQDGDVDFYGVYASWLGVPDMTIDAYYFLVRDAISTNDAFWPVNWALGSVLESVFGVNDYSVTNLHTIGLRGAGVIGAFDYEAEIAYQFGRAHAIGWQFGGALPGSPSIYGDDDSKFAHIGANLEVGYTFDMQMNPRVYLGAAYLQGEDNRDISFARWLVAGFWPWYQPQASVSFNRLFSDWQYSEFLDAGDLSNVIVLRGGVSAMVTEKIEVELALSHFQADEAFSAPPSFRFLGLRVPWAPGLSFWTSKNSSSLAYELGLYGTYNYSEDLSFSVGYAHLFVESGLKDGSFVLNNGLTFAGGTRGKDADYAFVETKIAF